MAHLLSYFVTFTRASCLPVCIFMWLVIIGTGGGFMLRTAQFIKAVCAITRDAAAAWTYYV